MHGGRGGAHMGLFIAGVDDDELLLQSCRGMRSNAEIHETVLSTPSAAPKVPKKAIWDDGARKVVSIFFSSVSTYIQGTYMYVSRGIWSNSLFSSDVRQYVQCNFFLHDLDFQAWADSAGSAFSPGNPRSRPFVTSSQVSFRYDGHVSCEAECASQGPSFTTRGAHVGDHSLRRRGSNAHASSIRLLGVPVFVTAISSPHTHTGPR